MGKKSRKKKERKKNPAKIKPALERVNKNLFRFIIILVILTVLLYWRSLYNDFVNLDDNEHVYNNPVIKSLKVDNISEMFTGSRMGNWIPLTQLSFALDHHFWDLNAFGYHLTNLLLHLANTLLVFWLFFLLTGNSVTAFVLGLMFSFHPLHVESVAWITERKDVLYAFYYLLAVIFWHFWRLRKKWQFFLLTIIGFILSLLSKSMAVTLPALLILLDHFYYKIELRKAIIDKIPLFMLSFAAVIITWRATYSSTTVPVETTFIERILLANYSFWFYPFKLLLPFQLSAIYPHPQLIYHSLPAYFYLLPLLTIALIIFLKRQKNQLILIGFWMYFLMILPVLQLLPLAGTSFTCDRFTYLPGLGIFLIFLAVFRRGEEASFKGSRNMVFVIVGLFWGVLSWLRIPVWENGITLHSDIINKYPDIELPYINRGKAFSERGEHGRAIDDFSSAIRVTPGSADAYNNRGNEFGDLKKIEAALEDLSKAIELRPDFAEAYSNRAHIYLEAGNYAAAEADFSYALKLDPDYASGWYNRGNFYRTMKKFELAISDYDQALQLAPHMAEAYNNRGTARTMLQQYKQAIKDFDRALSLQPDNISFLNNRGNANKDMGNNRQALADFNRAIKINPGYTNAYHNRAVLYFDEGDYKQARRDIEKVKQMNGYVNPAFEKALQQKDRNRE